MIRLVSVQLGVGGRGERGRLVCTLVVCNITNECCRSCEKRNKINGYADIVVFKTWMVLATRKTTRASDTTVDRLIQRYTRR